MCVVGQVGEAIMRGNAVTVDDHVVSSSWSSSAMRVLAEMALYSRYKSAEKYIGSDTLELLVLLSGGFAQEVLINIDVR